MDRMLSVMTSAATRHTLGEYLQGYLLIAHYSLKIIT